MSVEASPQEREAMWERLVGYAAEGDAAHEARAAGQTPKPILTASDVTALADELSRLSSSAAFARHAPIAERMSEHARIVREAAGKLPA